MQSPALRKLGVGGKNCNELFHRASSSRAACKYEITARPRVQNVGFRGQARRIGVAVVLYLIVIIIKDTDDDPPANHRQEHRGHRAERREKLR